ncbi:MAG: DUF1566 domain-containing protein [Deltaproteobacteria bacterium]|nr:DUF1566 domain-containing protein [Deltaproteobacteria bacterium]
MTSQLCSILLSSVVVIFIGIQKAHATGAGITYHGRLIDPNGNPVVSSNVQFRLQIKTPGNENCLMYEEVQNKDLSMTSGAYAVTINDGTGSRLDSTGFALDQIFANRNSFTFAGGNCAAGATYTPNATDSRKIQVFFNDGTFPIGQWEPVAPMAINFVPMAIESMQVGGYKKEQLIKIADGVSTTGTELNSASWTELLALIGGTTTQYVKSGSANFTAAPQWNGVPSGANDLVNKTYVDAQVVAGLPNVGTPGTYAKVTTDTKGRVTTGAALVEADIPTLSTAGKVSGSAINAGTLAGSTAINSSGNLVTTGTVQGATVSATNLRAYNGANYVQLAAPALGAGNLNFILPSTDGASGTLMKTNGSGQLSFGTLSSSDIPSLDAGKITTGTLPVARGGTGLTSYGNNSVLVSNGTGSAISSLNCTIGQIIKFDASGFAGCGTDSTGGSSQWTTTGSDIYYNAGKVGIGLTTPAAALDVLGANTTVGNAPAAFIVNGGTSTAGSGASGGAIGLKGGLGDRGGNIYLTGGDNTFGASGGYLTIEGGNWGGPGGLVTLSGGLGKNGSVGGTLSLKGGNNFGGGQGGTIDLAGGTGTANGNGGDLTILGGAKAGSGADGNVLLATTRGNVGIGTTSPAAPLDVAGDVKIGNSSASCSSTNKGSIRYNNASSVLEFCNGTSWNLIQAAACSDATPNVFVFTDQSNQTTSTQITSDIVQVSGINCTIPVTVSGVGSPQFQICSDSGCSSVVQGWTSSPSSIVSGQYLQVRQTSDAAGGATSQATIIAGTTASIWSISTAGGDCVGTTPPVGTVCADGTIYAGISPDTSAKMFTTRCDYGQTWNGSACIGSRLPQNWNNGTSNWTTTGYSNSNTGKANSAGLFTSADASSPYAAATICENLNQDGHTDWYLPSKNELNIMYAGKNTIRNFDTSGTYYWSSTENNSFDSWNQRISDGSQNIASKNNAFFVRCSRR